MIELTPAGTFNTHVGTFVWMRATGCAATALYDCNTSVVGDPSCEQLELTIVHSALSIDGAPFAPSGSDLCHSGDGKGESFFGVDLWDPVAGETLRVVQNADLSDELVVIGPDQTASQTLTSGFTATVTNDSSFGTGPFAVSGSATIGGPPAQDVAHSVTGSITFTGCD
jgi:hypothetical protein